MKENGVKGSGGGKGREKKRSDLKLYEGKSCNVKVREGDGKRRKVIDTCLDLVPGTP